MKTIFLWSKILKKLETRNKKNTTKKFHGAIFCGAFYRVYFSRGNFPRICCNILLYCESSHAGFLSSLPLFIFFFEKKTAFQR